MRKTIGRIDMLDFEAACDILESYLTHASRWSYHMYTVLRDKQGLYWEYTSEEPATEMQDGMLTGDEEYELVQVEPYEKTITAYRPVKEK